MSNKSKWFSSKIISEVLDLTERSVRRKAQEENWPFKWGKNEEGNKAKLYQVPSSIDMSDATVEADTEEPGFFFMASSYPEGKTDEEYLEEYIKITNQKLKEQSKYSDIIINDDKPIALTFVSDQHLGEYAYVERMVEDAELISETEGMYAVLGGDGWDNYIKHYSALVNKGSKARHERAAFRAYLRKLKDSILHVISGNHEGWTQAFSSLDPVEDIASEMGLSYSKNWKGVLRLQFVQDVNRDEYGDIIFESDELETSKKPYIVLVQHKSRYESGINPEHACRTTVQRGEVDADIVCICHKHIVCSFPFYVHDRERFGVRPGTYKILDNYAIKHGFVPELSTCPVVVIYPGETKKMVGFKDLRDGIVFLKAIRSKWQNRQ